MTVYVRESAERIAGPRARHLLGVDVDMEEAVALRKQLIALLGWGRVLSYGTLYPCLKALVKDGYIVAAWGEPSMLTVSSWRRRRWSIATLLASLKIQLENLNSGR